MSTSDAAGGSGVSVGCRADVRAIRHPKDITLAMLRRRSAMSGSAADGSQLKVSLAVSSCLWLVARRRSHVLEIAPHAAVRGRHLRPFVEHPDPHGLLRGRLHVDI